MHNLLALAQWLRWQLDQLDDNGAHELHLNGRMIHV